METESNVLEADNSYTMNESSGVKTKAINIEPLLSHELHEAMTPLRLTSFMGMKTSLLFGSPVLLCSLI